MALGNTPRRETNISLEQGKSYALGVNFRSAAGPLDVTDTVLRMVVANLVQRGGVEVLSKEAVTLDALDGRFQFQFQAEELALPAGSYPYDMTIVPPSGFSSPVLKGALEIGTNTDYNTSNTFTEVNAGDDLTIVLDGVDVVEINIERLDGMLGVVQNLISDFKSEMEDQVVAAAASATQAQAWAGQAANSVSDLETYLADMGFPYWAGTRAEYAAVVAPNPAVLYLTTD